MKLLYGSAILTLITGTVCYFLNPSDNLLPQTGTQNILSDDPYSVPGHNPFKYCAENNKENLLQIDYINVEPDQIQRGQKVSIDLVGQLLDEVSDGAYALVTVKLGLIRLFQAEIEICDKISDANLTCPIGKGPIKLHSEYRLPEIIPPGKFNIDAQAYNYDDMELFCLKSTIDFSQHLPRN